MTKYNFSAPLAGKLDKAKGSISDVSIISEGPALGHGVDIDSKTLSGIFELTKNEVVKSYWTHGGIFDGDRLGEEVGLFSAFHIVGQQLKAHFRVLEAFRKAFPARWDYLTELVEKAPKEFGVSIHFEGTAVWVLDTGAEVPAESTERPANALGEPRVRVHRVLSADFVSTPAANSGGLFSQGKVTELLDLKQKLTGDLADLSATLSKVQGDLAAKVKESNELAAKNEELSKSLEADRASSAAKEAQFLAEKGVLEVRITELASSVEKFTSDLRAKESEAAQQEAAFKAQMDAMQKTLISFGAVPVNIYNEVIDHKATFAAIKDPVEKSRYWSRYKNQILANG